jgi:uncharacterized membrane protein
MDELLIIFGLLGLFIFVGSILGWIAFFRTQTLTVENAKLKKEINSLCEPAQPSSTGATSAPNQSAAITQSSSSAQKSQKSEQPQAHQLSAESEVNWYRQLQADESIEPIETPETPSYSNEAASNEWLSSSAMNKSTNNNKAAESSIFTALIASAASHWMIWVGGVSIGFSGIFLVKYSLDNNLLGPEARILVALLIGALLHVSAYKLHQIKGRYDAFAALAGGGSLIFYSALLAALHLYNLLSPNWIFILLLLVSIATMLLALMYGPVLAAIGILGAYLIPIFVNTGSNNIIGALVYSFIITISALLLIRYVSRRWLWMGTLAGAGFWWLISLGTESADIPRLLYLIALTYAVVAIYQWDWRLLNSGDDKAPCDELSVWQLFRGDCVGAQGVHKNSIYFVLLFVQLAVVASIGSISLSLSLHWLILLMPLLILWLALNFQQFLPLGWISFLAVVAGLFLQTLSWDSSVAITTWQEAMQNQHLLFLTVLAVMYSGTAYIAIKTSDKKYYWSSLGFIAPLVLLTVGFIFTHAIQTSWQWALIAGVIGALYFNILYRQRHLDLSPEIHAVLIIAGHLAYSLAAVMLAREATLTLALAVQVVSLVWVDRYFRLPILPYLVKGILAIIIFRLTFNPWLLTYAADTHWSLWTYGGSFLCCIAAAYLLKNRDDLMGWLQAVSLHLLLLTLVAETRYQLYVGDIFIEQYSFFEAAFYTLILSVTGLVYKIRARFATSLRWFYESAASILLLGALANYSVFLLVVKNPLFIIDTISTTIIWNLLLLAYGAPCLVAGVAILLDKRRQWRQITGAVAALSLLIFVSVEVRHIWQGELDISQPMLAGELYTYSMVWLFMAIVGSLLSLRYTNSDLYRASMLFLMIVVGKIFLIDTAGLSSLLRVAAFLGLGLSLLGLSYFHQKMGAEFTQSTNEEADLNSDNNTINDTGRN